MAEGRFEAVQCDFFKTISEAEQAIQAIQRSC